MGHFCLPDRNSSQFWVKSPNSHLQFDGTQPDGYGQLLHSWRPCQYWSISLAWIPPGPACIAFVRRLQLCESATNSSQLLTPSMAIHTWNPKERGWVKLSVVQKECYMLHRNEAVRFQNKSRRNYTMPSSPIMTITIATVQRGRIWHKTQDAQSNKLSVAILSRGCEAFCSGSSLTRSMCEMLEFTACCMSRGPVKNLVVVKARLIICFSSFGLQFRV